MKGILVVKDSTVKELIRFLFTAFGSESKEAGTGVEALKTANENRFDLILPDIPLPGSYRLEVFKEIKKFLEICRTSVTVLTVYIINGGKGRLLKAGCSRYVAMPVETGKFKLISDSCMGRYLELGV